MGERVADSAERAGLSACVLLAGAIKPSPLVQATGFSTLDLLVGPDVTLLDEWGRRLLEIGIEPRDVAAVHGANVPPPNATPGTIAMKIRRERDHLRGPAGAAKDAAASLGGDAGLGPGAGLVIAEAKRYPGVSLAPLLKAWHETGADIVVARNPDRSPAGLYAARAGLLDLVPGRGFMDLKEQWLGKAVESGARAVVVDLPPPGALPVRILPQYLRVALRDSPLERFATGVLGPESPRHAVVSPAARVDPTADLIDAVVMEGGVVSAGAAVVRSVVCPGGRVEPGAQVVDAVVTESGERSDKMMVSAAGFRQGWR